MAKVIIPRKYGLYKFCHMSMRVNKINRLIVFKHNSLVGFLYYSCENNKIKILNYLLYLAYMKMDIKNILMSFLETKGSITIDPKKNDNYDLITDLLGDNKVKTRIESMELRWQLKQQ